MGDEEYFELDPEKLAEDARLAEGHVMGFDETLTTIKQEMEGVFASWQSPAADHFAERYRAALLKIDEQLETYRAYPKRLNEVLNTNATAHRVAVNIAESIEPAQWTEVS